MSDKREPSQSSVPHRGGSIAPPSPALIAAFIALCALSVATTLLINFRCRNGFRWGRHPRRPPARIAHRTRSTSHRRKSRRRRTPRIYDAYLDVVEEGKVGWQDFVPLAASVLPTSSPQDKLLSDGKRIQFQDPSKQEALCSNGVSQPARSCPLSILAPGHSILVPPPPIQVQVTMPILMPVGPTSQRGDSQQDASVCLGMIVVPLSTRGLGRG
ncbi:hypothetical protein K523DRAFT_306325 [Schizophyllum commune Tattone D]|nr:hypothetical protein K523DRAFT_306325 [Schizophyllum commune Tattone D]